MKLLDTILLSIAFAGVLIGAHQTYKIGFAGSYWIFMISIALVLYLRVRRGDNNKNRDVNPSGKNISIKNRKR